MPGTGEAGAGYMAFSKCHVAAAAERSAHGCNVPYITVIQHGAIVLTGFPRPKHKRRAMPTDFDANGQLTHP